MVSILSRLEDECMGYRSVSVKDVSLLFPLIPYRLLKFKKRSGYEKRIITNDQCKGFDTETNYKGDIVLLADSEGRYLWNPTLDEIIEYLIFRDNRNTLNWFYNITFDVESILKMLPEDNLLELMKTNKTKYKDYKLNYLPHKYFSITDSSKHKVDFYDIAQFYHSSLNNAAKEYLGSKKDDIEIKGIMEYIYEDKVKEVVLKYCIQDCKLTRDLAQRLINSLNKCKIPISKPYSTASLSEIAFLSYCDIPEYLQAPKIVNQMAYWSYYGGWFELFKRGYYGDSIYEYDINSAYPYAMMNQPDFRDLEWESVKKRSQDAVLGFYHVYLTPKRNMHISPLQIRTEKLSIHPQIATIRYVNDIEYDMLKDAYKIRILKGYEGFSNNPSYPLKEFVQKLYSDRMQYKKSDQMMQKTLKIILNGMYGKFIQRVDGKIGNTFNPIYASRITASCRKQIWDAVKDHQDQVIGIQTDSCIMTNELDLEISNNLGDWSRSEYNEGLFLISGIYELNGEKKKTKIRGFDSKLLLKELLLKNKDKDVIEVRKEKPLHIKQAIIRKDKEINQTNQFLTEIKKLSCRFDDKRVWTYQCEDWGEFCRDFYESSPITREFTPMHEDNYIKLRLKLIDEYNKYSNDENSRISIR